MRWLPEQPLDRMEWMPSPSLVPDDRLIDTEHLARVTMGDAALQREVLTLFVSQSNTLLQQLAVAPERTAVIAHTLKGSARGIGAVSAAECAERLELAAGDRRAGAAALDDLRSTVAETIGAIQDLLKFS